MKSKAIKEKAFSSDIHGWDHYLYEPKDQQAFEITLLEDYEDYMTDRISRELGKVFDRKAVIKEFLKQL